MRKRPRRRRPKRSGRVDGSQRSQKLSKRVRELYQPASAGDPEDAEWHSEMEQELEASLSKRPRTSADTARPPEPKPGRSTTDESTPVQTTSDAERSGRVVAISSGACRVASGEQTLDCILPSELARDQRSSIAVGDQVTFAAHGTREGILRLRRVLPRRTVLSRPDPQNPRRERVIAANIDIAVHVASVVRPPLRPALIDRYLIAISQGGADAAVFVNKIDLLADAGARRRQLEQLTPFRDLGLAILPCSAETGEGIDRIRALLAGRTAVLVGHSGVGKSSILNALSPGLDADTGGVSERYGKGRHTTTRSSLYRLEDDIRIIDTPGIREFGLWKLTAGELSAYFADFEPHAASCRFSDCVHFHEPDCGVRAAVEIGQVAEARYLAYLRIRASLEDGD